MKDRLFCLSSLSAAFVAVALAVPAMAADSDLRRLSIRHTTDFSSDLARFSYETGGETKTVIAGKTESVMPGTEINLIAKPAVQNLSTGSCKVCGDFEYEYFQWWTVSPASADLGEGFCATDPETQMTMPKMNVTLAPSYVSASKSGWLTMYAAHEEFSCGDRSLQPDDADFEWSPDGGKHWFKSGQACCFKAGVCTVTWRSLDVAWLAPAKAKITVVAEAEVDNEATMWQDSLFVPAVTFAADVETIGGGMGGTVSISPKTGVLAAGQKVTLSASAKGGYVFVGFQEPAAAAGEYCLTEKKLVLTAGDPCLADENDGRIHYAAVFRKKMDYRLEDLRSGVTVRGNGHDIAVDFNQVSAENPIRLFGLVGCPIDASLAVAVPSCPVTAKFSGKLPSGVQFSSADCAFLGTPSKSGEFAGKVVVSDPGGNHVDVPFQLVIRPLPATSIGAYQALLRDECGGCAGLLDLSVTAAGKVSGKLTDRSGSKSFSGALTWECSSASPDPQEDLGTIGFELRHATVGLLAGTFSEDGMAEVDYPAACASGTAFRAGAAAVERLRSKTFTVPLSPEGEELGFGYLTLKFDARRSSVTVAGLLPDGTTISGTSSVLEKPDEETSRVMIFKSLASKKEQFHAELEVTADEIFAVDACWVRQSSGSCDPETNVSFTGTGSVYMQNAPVPGMSWELDGDGLPWATLAYDARGKLALQEKGVVTSFSFNKATGLFSGQATIMTYERVCSGEKVSVTFKGVVVGSGSAMRGYGTAYWKQGGSVVCVPVRLEPVSQEP